MEFVRKCKICEKPIDQSAPRPNMCWNCYMNENGHNEALSESNTQNKLSSDITSKVSQKFKKNLEKIEPKRSRSIDIISSSRKCEICGELLPVNKFYSSPSSPGGYTNKCKKCIKEKRAIDGISEITKYVNLNESFDLKSLKKKITDISPSTIDNYIWILQELDLIKYNGNLGTYNLEMTDKLKNICNKYNVSFKEDQITTKNNVNNSKLEKSNYKKCEECDRYLPLSAFRKSISTTDGYVASCKNCNKKRIAAEGLDKIKKYVNFDSPFSINILRKNMGLDSQKFDNYIYSLQDIDILTYDDETNTYIIKNTKELKEFIKKYGIFEDNEKSQENKDVIIQAQDNIIKFIDSLKDQSYLTIIESIKKLSNLNDERAINPLIECLTDNRPIVRKHAADALFKLKNYSLNPLINSLKSDNHFIKMHSAEILGRIGDKRAVKPLNKCLNDPHYLVRYNTVSALDKIGYKDSVPYLIKALEDKDELVKTVAKESLINLGKLVTSPLIKALNNEKNQTKEDIIYILCKIGDKEAITTFIDLFNRDKSLQLPLAKSFEQIGDKTALNFLLNNLDNDNLEVKKYIIKAITGIIPNITQISKKEALKKLEERLKNENEVKKELKNVISKINEDLNVKLPKKENKIVNNNEQLSSYKCSECGKVLPISEFNKSLISGDFSEKCKECDKKQAAKYALNKIKDYVTLNVLFNKKYLERKVKVPSSTIDRYIKSLRELGFVDYNENNKEYILNESQDLNSFCNEYGIQLSKSKMGHKTKFNSEPKGAQLIQIIALENEKPFTRRSAAKNLGNMGDETAIPYLIKALNDENTFVKLNVIESLGKIGDQTAIQPLIPISEDTNSNVAGKALDAIENIKNRLGIDEIPKKEIQLTKGNLDESIYKKCDDCGKNLPISEFYKAQSAPGGYTKQCKECMKKRIAKNALLNMSDFIKLDIPFSKKTLKTKINRPASTIDNYLWVLQELKFIDYIEKTDEYVLKSRESLNLFCEEFKIPLNKFELTDKVDNESVQELSEAVLIQINALKHTDWFTRKSAVKNLGNMGDKKAIPYLIKTLKDVDTYVKMTTIEVLGKIGDQTAIQPLIQVADNNNSKLKEKALDAVKKIKNRLEPDNAIKDSFIEEEQIKSNNESNGFSIFNDTNDDSSPDRFTVRFNQIIKKKSAAIGLKEIGKYISLNSPFSIEMLKKLNIYNSNLQQSLKDLQDLNILKYEEETNNYIIEDTENLHKFCKENQINLFSSQTDGNYEKNKLKVCVDCKKSLTLSEFFKSEFEEDGYSKKCKGCLRKNNAANGLRKIIKVIKPGIPFSRESIKKKIHKSDSTLGTYLHDLKDLGILNHNELTDKYTLMLTDDLKNFCTEYDIQLYYVDKDIPFKDNELENLQMQLIQISNNNESHFILEIKETIEKSNIMSLLKDIENKILNLKLLEISVKPINDIQNEDSNYNIKVKVEVDSKDLPRIINNLKLLDVSILNNMEISGTIKLKL